MKLQNEPIRFKSILVKPYHKLTISSININTNVNENISLDLSNLSNSSNTSDQDIRENILTNNVSAINNQNTLPIPVSMKCGHGRPRKYLIQVNLITPALKIGFVFDIVDKNNLNLFVINDINL